MNYRTVSISLVRQVLAARKPKIKNPDWNDEYKGAGILFTIISRAHTRPHVNMSAPEGEDKNLSLYRPAWEKKIPSIYKRPDFNLDALWSRSEKRVRGLEFHPEKGVPSTRELIDLIRTGADGKDWYENTRHALKEFLGQDSDKFLEFLAHTSPRATLVSNVHRAFTAYLRWKRGQALKDEELGGTGMYSVRRSLEKVMANEKDAGGPKVKSFIKSFYHDSQAVTVDVWLMRALGVEPGKSLGTGDYHTLAEAVRQLTRSSVVRQEFGSNITPRQVMAMLWIGIKRKDEEARNDRQDPYEVLIADLFKQKPELEQEVRSLHDVMPPDRTHHYKRTEREGKRRKALGIVDPVEYI